MSTEFFNDQWRIPSNENQNKISNYSMEFDGTSDFIDCGNLTGLNNLSAFSTSAWINYTGTLGTKHIFISGGTSSSNRFYVQLLSSTQIRYGSGSAYDNVTTSTITSGSWHNIVTVHDGTSLDIYLDGVKQNSSPVTVVAPNANIGNDFTIGKYFLGGFEWNGKLDQVTVFDYALSQDQVTQLGAEGYAFNFIPNDYIDLGTTTSYDTGDLSAAIWVNASSSRTGTVYAFSNSGSPSIAGFDFVIYTDNKVRIRRSTTTKSNQTNQISVGLASDTWQHLALTYSESTNTLKVFLNGVLKATNTGTNQTTIASKKLTIGSYNATSVFFDGELSNAVIFSSKLEDSEIATIYNNGKPLTDMSSFTSLQGWWKLDDTATFNSSTSVWTIPDASTNSNNGTSVGMNADSLVASNINGELVANPMITSPKPIAYYQLGDQSVDNGANYLVPNNSLSDYVFNFDGTGDFINAGSASYLNGLSQFSISVWFNLNTAADAKCIISDWNYNTSPFGHFSLRTTDTSGTDYALILYIKKDLSDAGSNAVKTSAIFTENTWHNVVFTYNSGTITYYVDGSPVSSTTIGTIASSLLNQDGILTIGNWPGLSQYWDGQISNTAVFNTALSTANIETIYNNGAPGDISSLSPIAWYKLNASEIFNSTSTEWSVDNNAYPSVYKSSLNFDGNNDALTIQNSSTFNLGTAFTISGWFNFASNKYQGLVSFDATSGGSPRGWFLFQIDTNNDIRLFDGTNVHTLKTSYTTTNKWDSFIITYDGTYLVFYINGNQESTQAVTVDLQTNGNDGQIGNNQFASSRFFDGEISNLALWNVGLTSTQVETLYNNGTPEASISHSPVSWWKLDNTTTGIQDSAGSNDGTNNGATEYAGFVNELAGESLGMDSSNLVVSDLQQTSGYSPYALDFDGVDDYLDFNNASSNIMTNKNSISISGWFKLNSNTSSTLAGNWYGGGVSQYLLRYNSSTGLGIQWYIYSNSNAFRIDTNYFPSVGDWVHVVGVKDSITSGGQIRVYINGFEYTLDNTDFSVAIANNNGSDQIGVFNNSSSFMNGSISNVAYWTDTALTQAQVTEIYNQGVPSNLNTFSGAAPTHWIQIGSNSSYNSGAWTCLDEIGTNNAVSVGSMTNNDIVDGPGYSASGLGTSSIDIKGDAPYSTANGLSENMDVLDRITDVAPS